MRVYSFKKLIGFFVMKMFANYKVHPVSVRIWPA